MVIIHSMKRRFSSFAVILSAALASSILAGMVVMPRGFDGIALAQTREDFALVQESVNDAREAIHANNTAEALEELETAERNIGTLTNQTETQAPQAENNTAVTSPQNQTTTGTTQNLTAEDLDEVQESLNSVREAIHTNNTAVALEGLTLASEDLASIDNETTG